MGVGNSGRIVIEVNPDFKQQLYAELKKENLTLKEWFTKNAETFIYEGSQLALKF